MPIYEYKCSDGHTASEWFPVAADATEDMTCKECLLRAVKIPFGLPAYVESQKKFTGGLRVKSFSDHTGKIHRV
jgi:hypothetical protein